MIDIKLYEKNAQFQKSYLADLKNRGEDPAPLKKAVLLNQERKNLIVEIEQLIHNRRKIEKELFSKNTPHQKKANLNQNPQSSAQPSDSQSSSAPTRQKAQKIGDQITVLQDKLRIQSAQIQDILLKLPNQCHSNVPIGSSNKDNQIVKTVGKIPDFSFPVQSHLELAQKNIDIERAGKAVGARFAFLRGPLAKLERALADYMLDVHTKQNGYEELASPFIMNEQSLTHTGQLPKFKDDLFGIQGSNYYLLPTAEVSLTNFFSQEVLMEKDLPVKFVCCSPCFRSEAGSAGKDTKGLLRQHQFTKVELVIFSHPDRSYEELERLTSHAEMILKDLELPYRVVNLCTGDLGFSSAQCYDLEVWMPSQKTYREISSCSNCEDYQARRGNIRFRSSKGLSFVHTLNGSGLAVGRTLIALLENHQNKDGSVNIPPKLQPYMDGQKTILQP